MIAQDMAYAQALFRAAARVGPEQVADELRALEPLILEHRRFFFNAGLPVARQNAVLREALDGRADPLTEQFLMMLCVRRRLHRLPHIRERYDALCAEALGELTVRLALPYAPDDALLQKLRDSLGRLGLYPHERRDRVTFTAEVEPALIGGFVAECGGRVIDASLKTVLANMMRNA